MKKRGEELDFNRFRSGFHLFHDLLLSIPKNKSNIVFYEDMPLQEFNKDFKRIEFDFGLLESVFRDKLQQLGSSSLRAGFEIESNIKIRNKNFTLVFNFLPRNRSKYYDIRIEILSNGYANIFEDLERFYPKFRKYILERIRFYNEKAMKTNKKLFTINKAVMSDHKKEFHNIDSWRFFYSKEPENFIINLYYGNKDLQERLLYANRDKFAEELKNLNKFTFTVIEYAKEAQVELKEGSIAIIPKNEESMKIFIEKLREKVASAAKKIYPTKEEVQRSLESVFSS